MSELLPPTNNYISVSPRVSKSLHHCVHCTYTSTSQLGGSARFGVDHLGALSAHSWEPTFLSVLQASSASPPKTLMNQAGKAPKTTQSHLNFMLSQYPAPLLS